MRLQARVSGRLGKARQMGRGFFRASEHKGDRSATRGQPKVRSALTPYSKPGRQLRKALKHAQRAASVILKRTLFVGCVPAKARFVVKGVTEAE